MVSRVDRDEPPETLYVVTLKSANAKIVVSPDEADFKDLEIAYPVFSEHVEKRYIRDSTGRIFGTDSWGYLPCRGAVEIHEIFHGRCSGI
jgi:hypothetical protein